MRKHDETLNHTITKKSITSRTHLKTNQIQD